MKIVVKSVQGETFNFDVNERSSILTLKKSLTDMLKVPLKSVELLFKGKIFNNNDELGKIGIV